MTVVNAMRLCKVCLIKIYIDVIIIAIVILFVIIITMQLFPLFSCEKIQEQLSQEPNFSLDTSS